MWGPQNYLIKAWLPSRCSRLVRLGLPEVGVQHDRAYMFDDTIHALSLEQTLARLAR